MTRDSHTADRVAAHRAAHQVLDRPPIFVDPLARRILDQEVARALELDPHAYTRSRLAPYVRAFCAVRSRFAEDQLAAAFARGVRQYLILGAGYDTFAYRNPFPELRVFEVDHPATQESKRVRLAAASIDIPDSLTFVPVDFSTTALRDTLGEHGFDLAAPAFCSWLGVVVYLELPAIEETLRVVGSLPTGTEIVLDYAPPPSSLSRPAQMVIEYMERRVERIGEPWKTYFSPDDLRVVLHRARFSRIDDYGPDDLTVLYLTGRDDGLRLGEAGHLAHARVQRDA